MRWLIGDHGLFQLGDYRVASPAHAALRHFREKSFHQIQQAGAGGGEMDVVARMALQPSAHWRHLVRGVVVHNQIHLKASRKITLHLAEEAEELLMAGGDGSTC